MFDFYLCWLLLSDTQQSFLCCPPCHNVGGKGILVMLLMWPGMLEVIHILALARNLAEQKPVQIPCTTFC